MIQLTQKGTVSKQPHLLGINRRGGESKFNDRLHLRRRATSVIYKATELGKIPKARKLKCVDCGKQARDYDHHKGYEKKHWFSIEPVCRSCHEKREIRRGVKIPVRGEKCGSWKGGATLDKKKYARELGRKRSKERGTWGMNGKYIRTKAMREAARKRGKDQYKREGKKSGLWKRGKKNG